MALAHLIALAALSVSASNPLDLVIRRVEARYNSVRTLSVHFTEQFSALGHARPPESGELHLKKVGKMRWDYQNPPGKLFLSDGKIVYLYTTGDNRVEKIPLKSTEDMRAPLAFLLGHLDVKKEFGDLRLHGGNGGVWLDGNAKSTAVPYDRVSMLISPDGSIRNLQVFERDGSELDFAFSDERLNPPLPDTLFRFTVPPGAEVVDSLEVSRQ